MSTAPNTAVEPLSPDLGTVRAHRSRRLVVATFLTVVIYVISTTGSKGICPGGVSSDGGFIDAAGQPTSVLPDCVQANMHPSPWAIALVVALTAGSWWFIRARAHTIEQAICVARTTTLGIITIVVLAIAISATVFYSSDMSTWSADHLPSFPFPLNVEVNVTPDGDGS